MILAHRDKTEVAKVDNMELHRQMYERRLRLLKEHREDEDLADGATDLSEDKKEKQTNP